MIGGASRLPTSFSTHERSSEDYAACFMLVDSIATDRNFDEEEQQIFDLLALTDKNAHPNASACLCKIALAVEDAPVQLPVSISYHAAVFVRSKGVVSARCRLSEEQEHRLMQLIHEKQLRAAAADSVLKQSHVVIVKAAAAGATPKPGAQAKMVEELLKNISAAASDAGVTVQTHDVPLLVSEWIKGRDQSGGGKQQTADNYDLVVLGNRRKQLEFRKRMREEATRGMHVTPAEEELVYSIHRPQGIKTATGLPFTFSRIQNVVQAAPDSWSKLNVQYNLERQISAARLSEIVAKLLDTPDALDGAAHQLGFLFLYDLMSGQTQFEQNAIDGDPSSLHEVRILVNVAHCWAHPSNSGAAAATSKPRSSQPQPSCGGS